MPRDQRLYMTFPNDFWMHPKVAPLPVEAKWTFVEMNGYSRMQDLDGIIPAVMAERLWDRAVLDELVASHWEKPLVILVDGCYVIRDYAEHQQTTEQRESLSKVRAEAGRKGRAKQLSDTSAASAGQVPGQIRAETESETETQKKTSSTPTASTEDFEEAWSHWPKKDKKKSALDKFISASKRRPVAELVADITRFGDAYTANVERQFVPALDVWIRGERWTDDLPTGKPSAQTTSQARAAVSIHEEWRMR